MPTFSTLWNNHPNVKDETPLLDKRQYPNQCAINIFATLQRSGVNVNSFHGQLSWQKGNPKYAIRAQEVANWLASSANPLHSKVQKFSGDEVFDKIDSLRGVIFFQNYWGPGNQGDHIDLWNGSRLTHWLTWFQIHARIGSIGFRSDLRESEAIWFWHIL